MFEKLQFGSLLLEYLEDELDLVVVGDAFELLIVAAGIGGVDGFDEYLLSADMTLQSALVLLELLYVVDGVVGVGFGDAGVGSGDVGVVLLVGGDGFGILVHDVALADGFEELLLDENEGVEVVDEVVALCHGGEAGAEVLYLADALVAVEEDLVDGSSVDDEVVVGFDGVA